MKDNNKNTLLNEEINYSKVPGWYTLCFNNSCPLRDNCMRYLSGSHAPEELETSPCVLPHTLKDGTCRWFDKVTVVTMASGFRHLYDKVLHQDYTRMRKSLTTFLHGSKFYYQYMRGERPLSPEQQEGIRQIVRSYGYDWEVPFERYYQDYHFGYPPGGQQEK